MHENGTQLEVFFSPFFISPFLSFFCVSDKPLSTLISTHSLQNKTKTNNNKKTKQQTPLGRCIFCLSFFF